MIEIFSKIKKMVESKTIKQSDVCESLGISNSNLSTILSEKSNPSKSLTKLAEIIYGNTRSPHPEPIIEKVILMMEEMEEHTKESALNCVQKEKLLRELIKEKQDKIAA